MADNDKVLVLGVGNPLMGDDGFGLVVLDALRDRWEMGNRVQLVDGGTWGMNLLPLIEDADALLILDAVNVGAQPGKPVTLVGDQIPRYFGIKLSPHQIDLKEVLGLCALRGTLPRRAAVIGVQANEMEMRIGLSPEARAAVGATADRAARQLTAWGYPCRRAEALLSA